MDEFNTIILIFFLSFIVSIGLFKSRHVKTENQYLLAERKTKLLPLIATLVMTEFNTSTLIAFSSAGYYARWWALTLPLVFLFGLLFYALTVAKKWKEFNGISVAYYFSVRYGRDIGMLVAIILFLSMVGFSATYIKSLNLIISPLFPHTNPWTLSGILTVVILLMTWRGGLTSIIRTDIISFIIVLFFFPVLLFYVYHFSSVQPGKQMTLLQMQHALPPRFVISLIFLTMFSYILAPWYGQKVISAESPRIATKAVIIAALLVFVLYAMGIAAVSLLAGKGVVLAEPEQALPFIIKNVLPISWQSVSYAVLFLVAATTLSGVWSAMITLLIGHHGNHSERTEQYRLHRSLILTIICALFSYILANVFIDQIFNKMILANIPIVALSFALLAGFYWKKTSRIGVYISVTVGLMWGTGCYLIYGNAGLYTWYWALYGIPLIFLAGMIGSIFYPELYPAKENIITKKALNPVTITHINTPCAEDK